MPRIPRSLLVLAAACGASSPAAAQHLLAVDSTADRVILLSAVDGSVVNPVFIDLTVAGASTPVEAIVVDNEIWVSDQIADKLMRFSLDGTTYLGDISGGLDNIRGIERVGNEVWVTNSGTGGGAPNDAIVRFSLAGANLGFFAVSDPFDVVNYQGDVLVSDISGQDLDRHDLTGAFISTFHDSNGTTGIDFPEQLYVRANGNVLAAGFITPVGVYEYDSAGAQVGYWAVGTGSRGVTELLNGNYLYSDGAGFKTLDPVSGATSLVVAAGGRYVTHMSAPGSAFVSFCPGDGTGTACPCGNSSAVGADEGCLNSLGSGGKLAGTGVASLTTDTVVLTGTQMPNSSALYFQGTTAQGGGAGVVFGDGLRCAGGSIVRLGTKSNVGGTSQYPVGADASVSVRGQVTSPGLRTYQVWYRNAAAFCTASTFNLSNGLEITWGA